MQKHSLFHLIAVLVLIIASTTNTPTLTTYAQANTFLDLAVNNPTYATANQLVAAEVISPNSYFYPNNTVSRAELSKILFGAGKYQLIFTELAVPQNTYCDVPTSYWAASYITTLSQHQIINGASSTQCVLGKSFFPNFPITRADASKMILSLYSLSPGLDATSNYIAAINLGLINNVGTPYQWMTRSEVSQVMIKAMTYYSVHYTEIIQHQRPASSSYSPTYSTSYYDIPRYHSYSSRNVSDYVPPQNTSGTSTNVNAPIAFTDPSPTPRVSTSPTASSSPTPTPTIFVTLPPSESPSPSFSPIPTPTIAVTLPPSESPAPSISPSTAPSGSPIPTPTPTSSSPSPTPSSLPPSPSPSPSSPSALDTALTYDIGSPHLQEFWISPTGSNDNPGTQSLPFATFGHAWDLVPTSTPLSSGFLFHVLPGTYSSPDLYVEDRLGTATAPVVFQGEGSVNINGNFNSRNLHYIYFINLSYTSPNDVMHFELADHVLLRHLTLRSPSRGAQEGLKVNQSQFFFVEDSDISGAHDNPVDFVAVQYGHVVRSKIHDGEDWCMYTKGGSASLQIEANEFFDCGTGGFTAGQGTGFEYMTPPWLHYEAYDIRVVNNVIHDTAGAGLGVNGGYNILMAHNTLYSVGSRSHTLEIVFGSHSCDGDTTQCAAHAALGGWGPSVTGSEVFIGDRHVRIFDNIIYNPASAHPADQIFAIYGPRPVTDSSSAPNPAVTDTDLVIKGNLIWNGTADTPLGLGDEQGCLPTNPTCNETQLRHDNLINTLEPQLSNPAAGNWSLVNRSAVTSLALTLPSFAWSDAPATPSIPTTTTVTNLPYSSYRDGTSASALFPGAY